jgi:hypothetical protein
MEFTSPTEDEWFDTLSLPSKIEHLQQKIKQLHDSNERLMANWSRENPDRIDDNDSEIRHLEAEIQRLNQ